jgi:hypothetical protein
MVTRRPHSEHVRRCRLRFTIGTPLFSLRSAASPLTRDIGEHAIHRCTANPERSGDSARTFTAGAHTLRQSRFGGIQCLRAADSLAACSSSLTGRRAALSAQLQLKLSEAGKHTSHHAARSIRRVDAGPGRLAVDPPIIAEYLKRVANTHRSRRQETYSKLTRRAPYSLLRAAQQALRTTQDLALPGVLS